MIKVLLVDDERITRNGISAMLPLEQLNLRITGSCANAFHALDSMADDMPDILITDIKMPSMDGLELIERALKLNPALRCIVLSGYEEFSFAQKAIKMGVSEYLLKPCTKEEMIPVMERICNEINAERRKTSENRSDIDARVEDLASQLAALSPGERDRFITGNQVRALAEVTGEERIIREAFTYLIAHQELQAEQGFDAIRQAYTSNADWAEAIAAGLNSMQLYMRQRRSFVNVMCDYIHAHYQDDNLSLQFLADHVVNMQADYIGREFTRATGKKLSAYLMEVRMERAKVLLRASKGEMRVCEVAEAVGLGENIRYFSTLFRKYTGQTPKEYGRNISKNTDF